MRYYPKNAVGFEFNEEVAELLSEEVKELFSIWDGSSYDDELFDAIYEQYGVTPMRVGRLNEERGGEVTGVTGFDNYTNYLFFDPEEQDDSWKSFAAFLNENFVTIYKGSWSQLG